MSLNNKPSGKTSAQIELEAHAERLQATKITDLFKIDDKDNESRAENYNIEAADLTLDYSKQAVDTRLLDTLQNLAEEGNLQAMREALFNDIAINNTEERAALHTLLRSSQGSLLPDKQKLVKQCQKKMSHFVTAVHSGDIRGFSGKQITSVVNIGIGGSDLGPRLATRALTAFHLTGISIHYIANLDPVDISETLTPLNAETTLFIICSKSFISAETLQNAEIAIQWLRMSAGDSTDISQQLVAVTANPKAAIAFGVTAENIFPMWDWVGGRYSLWSAVGLSTAIAIGMGNFLALLNGAEAMDKHFREAPWRDNMPAMMALLEYWSTNYLGSRNHGVIPYAQTLHLLPAFLQQLSMESNGKQVTTEGADVDYSTAPILWGDVGSNGQHSFHQLLHQGTVICPIDFILPLSNPNQNPDQHARLVANCISQSQALLVGRDLSAAKASLLSRGIDKKKAKQLAPHLVIPGNRPHSMITMRQLTPETLGALLALYEHKTACCAALWKVNAFDQWGVELGKELSKRVLASLQDGKTAQDFDSSTQKLIEAYRRSK